MKKATVQQLQRDPEALLQSAAEHGAVGITRRGKVVAWLVDPGRLMSFVESEALSRNPDLMAAVRADREGRLKFYPVKVPKPRRRRATPRA